MKLKEKKQAIKLRKQGYSIREISKSLRVAKSSASLWVQKVSLSKTAKKKLSEKYTKGQLASQNTHREQTKQKLFAARQRAKATVAGAKIRQNEKRILCAMLYWCEGKKSINDSEFAFTNSDPDLIKLFLYLFRKSFYVDERKFRVCVHLHDYHNKEKQLRFWSKITNIPLSKFIAPYWKKNTGVRIREGYPGCVSIRYHCADMGRELQAIAREVLIKGSSVNW